MNTDLLHVPKDQIEWNESFYFNLYDKANNLCAFMRIGLKPNKDDKSMFCYMMLPDGSFAGSRVSSSMDNDSLSVGGLSFECLEPEKRWKLEYAGQMTRYTTGKEMDLEVEFKLVFQGINEIFNYRKCVSGEKERMSQSVASEHLEQFGKVCGELRYGDHKIEICALGERDHSWGARDWNAPRMWIWLTCEFSEALALNVTKLSVQQGDVDAGFFHIDGTDHPITKATIDTVYDDEGAPISFVMDLSDASGEVRTVSAKVLRNVKMPFKSDDGSKTSIMHETLAEYEYLGNKGYGIAEYLLKKE